ncbi:homocysteine biosynthesis protein [bacterium]|nr:homocysteine biosynthesis protein [bacterium]MBU1152596.1 homocysteine biosynthesis protein [bacterium]MBU1782519.1 homocysteine biosynthesis protein [bacterium]
MAKTIAQINEQIKKGQAVVVTAEEIIDLVDEKGLSQAAKEVDVVTTGTFGPMCSSGVYFNFGHSKPKIKAQKVWLNDVPAYAGLAAVDAYLGAAELLENDPTNTIYPGAFKYGGGHVIEELVAGKDIRLKATSYGTDCYPRKELETWINIKDLNEVVLFNPRNAYQNYNVAVNLSEKIIYTYLGVLLPKLGNAIYCSAGQLSPLLNDPLYLTIGIGSRIFLGGGIGYVVWQGTQHNPKVFRGENDVPRCPAGTLAVLGDLKQMKSQWLRGVSMTGYGVTLAVGIGVPIPILNEEICRYVAVKDEEIYTQVIDYSEAYPQGKIGSLAEVNYDQLKSGKIMVQDKEVPTGSLSSYAKAREIANTLKEWIKKGEFLLSEPVQMLPSVNSEITSKSLKERPEEVKR